MANVLGPTHGKLSPEQQTMVADAAELLEKPELTMEDVQTYLQKYQPMLQAAQVGMKKHR